MKAMKAPPCPVPVSKGAGPKGFRPPPRILKLGPPKGALQPKVPMKRLFWTSFALPDYESDSKATVWSTIEKATSSTSEAQLHESDARALEEHLGDAKGGRGSAFGRLSIGGASKTKTRQIIRILDENRRRQLCIMLARLPPVAEAIEAIAELDDLRLNSDQVELLIANLPSPEEVTAVRGAEAELQKQDGDAVLDVAEAFVAKLVGVQAFALRVNIWSFDNAFDERFELFQSSVTDLRRACSCLRQSTQVPRLLALALSVGNFLNAGTSRGCADGFSVESLSQMCTVKSKQQNGFALVDFIVQKLERGKPGELEALFLEGAEAEAVRQAARHKFADRTVELAAYRAQAEELVRRTAEHQDDDVLSIRGHRIEMRLQEILALQGMYEEAKNEYHALCAWFRDGGARGQYRPSEEFFAHWDRFLQTVHSGLDVMYGRRRQLRRAELAKLRRPLQTVQQMAGKLQACKGVAS
eukprot:TRINITY_DN18909_c0_g1_i2.p1 TRINITY_DN18909_c0_g1~~TRINITY_DN18909_c0_g1_i2.p1  ORF type:complete len:470 (+),score=111.95 TRINITY_DN18909_c0_g1_i2:330-1739(+)